MPLFSRSKAAVPPVPPLDRAVVARLDLRRGERPLAHAEDTSGRVFVATKFALFVPVGSTGEHRRIPWHLVQAADWDNDAAMLTLVEWGEPDAVQALFSSGDVPFLFPGRHGRRGMGRGQGGKDETGDQNGTDDSTDATPTTSA